MLKKVLKQIKDADYISKTNIATKLNKSVGLIEDAFSQLIRMGYLQVNDNKNNCNSNCNGCPFANSCANQLASKEFRLTEKGERLLAK